MDLVALEKAFEIYPDTKVVVIAHLYGTPGKVDQLNEIIKTWCYFGRRRSRIYGSYI